MWSWFFGSEEGKNTRQPLPPGDHDLGPNGAPVAPAAETDAERAERAQREEEVRRKRIERYAQPNASSPAPRASGMVLKPQSPQPQPQPQPKAPAAAPAPAPAAPPAAKSPEQRAAEAPKAAPTNPGSRLLAPQQKPGERKQSPAAAPRPAAQQQKTAETPARPSPSPSTSPQPTARVPGELREWEQLVLSRVLGLDWRATPLCAEVAASAWADGLSKALLDRAVVLAMETAAQQPVDFALEALARALREGALTRHSSRVPAQCRAEHEAAVADLRSLLASYAGLAAMYPSLLASPAAGAPQATPRWRVLRALGGALESLNKEDLLEELVRRFGPTGELSDLMAPLFQELFERASRESDTGILRWLNLLTFLASKPETAYALCASHLWLPQLSSGAEVESKTILGIFLRRSPLPPPQFRPMVAMQNFPNVDQNGSVMASMNALRQSLHAVQTEVAGILLSLLSDAATREHALKWMCTAVSLNTERRKMHFDENATATDGFMCNLTAVMLEVVNPLCSLDPSKTGIDPRYFLTEEKRRIDLTDRTKLAASDKEVMSWVDVRNPSRQQEWQLHNKDQETLSITAESKAASGTYSTMATECFFATMLCFDLGFARCIQRLSELQRAYSHHRQQMEELEAKGQDTSGAKSQVDMIVRMMLCYHTMLLDESLLANAGSYFDLTTRWMLFLVCPEGASIPLPTEVPMEFASLPEFCVVNLGSFIKFAAVNSEVVLQSPWVMPVMDFIVCFLSSPAYIRSPYTRAELVQAVAALVPRPDRRVRVDVFTRNALLEKYLIPTLLDFYVTVEHTGSHTQFYDKFWWRSDVQTILEYVRPLANYRASFAETVLNKAFTKFAIVVVNDTNFLLDEVVQRLETITAIEEERQDTQHWASLNPEVVQDKLGKLAEAEANARSFSSSATASISLLHRLATEDTAPVLIHEDVRRPVAEMLDYFFTHLAGAGSEALRRSKPERFSFDMRTLLKQIVGIYVALGALPDSEPFIEQIAQDGRCFKPEAFEEAVSWAQESAVVSADEAAELRQVIARATKIKSSDEVLEEMLGDIPDEFVDPLMGQLMTDPVLLSTSQMIVDRSTIARHLMTNNLDPFSRTPLTIDQVKPVDDLRERIQAFVKERLGKK
eukprot:m51a1_g1619 hypothetical protein (1130) ;mRNA; r:224458-228807